MIETAGLQPIQTCFFQESGEYLEMKAFFQNLWRSKKKSNRLNPHLKHDFNELVERCRPYEILKVEQSPGRVRLTLANLWSLTRCENQPRLILHTFDLAEGLWREQDPEAITWREFGEQRFFRLEPNSSEIVWPVIESNCQENSAKTGLFKNLLVALLEKLILALDYFQSSESDELADFIFRRLIQLPSKNQGQAINAALHRHIWDKRIMTALLLPSHYLYDRRISLSHYLEAQGHVEDLDRINRESPNCLPLLNFISPIWWGRRDLLQDEVLKEVGPIFKNASPAGLRWLRRASTGILGKFHHCFEEKKQHRTISETNLLSTGGEVVNVLAGLSPQAAGPSELLEMLIEQIWSLLLKLNQVNPKPPPVLAARLARLLARHIMAVGADTAGRQDADDYFFRDAFGAEAIIDWFRAEGQERGLPDKNSTWLSVKRRSDKWHEEVWRQDRNLGHGCVRFGPCWPMPHKAEEGNLTWDSLLKEMTIDGVIIKPLVSGADLYTEGREMRHCVSSYSFRCLKDGLRLFSLTEPDGTRSTLSLIPQNIGFAIDQHKGLNNRPVSFAAAKAAREVCRLYTLKHLGATEAAA